MIQLNKPLLLPLYQNKLKVKQVAVKLVQIKSKTKIELSLTFKLTVCPFTYLSEKTLVMIFGSDMLYSKLNSKLQIPHTPVV